MEDLVYQRYNDQGWKMASVIDMRDALGTGPTANTPLIHSPHSAVRISARTGVVAIGLLTAATAPTGYFLRNSGWWLIGLSMAFVVGLGGVVKLAATPTNCKYIHLIAVCKAYYVFLVATNTANRYSTSSFAPYLMLIPLGLIGGLTCIQVGKAVGAALKVAIKPGFDRNERSTGLASRPWYCFEPMTLSYRVLQTVFGILGVMLAVAGIFCTKPYNSMLIAVGGLIAGSGLGKWVGEGCLRFNEWYFSSKESALSMPTTTELTFSRKDKVVLCAIGIVKELRPAVAALPFSYLLNIPPSTCVTGVIAGADGFERDVIYCWKKRIQNIQPDLSNQTQVVNRIAMSVFCICCLTFLGYGIYQTVKDPSPLVYWSFINMMAMLVAGFGTSYLIQAVNSSAFRNFIFETFESNLVVSPSWLVWAVAVVNHYAVDPRIAGTFGTVFGELGLGEAAFTLGLTVGNVRYYRTGKIDYSALLCLPLIAAAHSVPIVAEAITHAGASS